MMTLYIQYGLQIKVMHFKLSISGYILHVVKTIFPRPGQNRIQNINTLELKNVIV